LWTYLSIYFSIYKNVVVKTVPK